MIGSRLHFPIDLDQATRPHAQVVLPVRPLAAAPILVHAAHPAGQLVLEEQEAFEASSIGASASVVASVVITCRNRRFRARAAIGRWTLITATIDPTDSRTSMTVKLAEGQRERGGTPAHAHITHISR